MYKYTFVWGKENGKERLPNSSLSAKKKSQSQNVITYFSQKSDTSAKLKYVPK
jgi:hypothetical protein